jgi:propanediol dehydratase large subunit
MKYLLKDRKQLKEKNILPSIEKDQWYASPITKYDFAGEHWIKVDDIELFIVSNKYNL